MEPKRAREPARPGEDQPVSDGRAAEAREEGRIIVTTFSAGGVREREATSRSEWQPDADPETVTWVHIVGLAADRIEPLGADYGLHPLVLEDISTPDERPKLEEYDRYLYVILKAVRTAGSGRSGRIAPEQVAVVLGERFVLSFQERGADVFASVRQRLRNGGRIRHHGADHLAYVLLDTIVDEYFVVNERLGDEIESFEERLIRDSRPEQLGELHRLRRQLIVFRKAVWPLREVVGLLGRGDTALIRDDTRPFLRDLYDHVIEVMDGIETQRDIITGLLDLYLSSVSNRLNEVMKVLTVISTIFIPLTFVAGLYGMNFEHMPELREPWAYPAVLVLMAAIALAMLAFFRRRRWL